MAATAPVCNVTVTAPDADPTVPDGFRILPPTASLKEVIEVINNNTRAMQRAFDSMVARSLDNGLFPKTTYQAKPSSKPGQQPKKGNLGDEIDRRIGRLRFQQQGVRREKIKVVNPKDKDDYVVDDRVMNLVMVDRRTGAQWTFKDDVH